VPLLALLLPVDTVVPLMVLLGTTVSLANLLHLHHALRLKPLAPLLAGYLIGTPLGLLVLKQAPERWVLGMLGLLIAGYALFALSGGRADHRWLRERRITIGTLSGALGAAFSINGPPVILHVSAHPEWGADAQKAALTLFFLISGMITGVALGLGGLMTAPVFGLFGWCLPALLAGAVLGAWLYRRLGEHDYRRLVLGLVLTTGLALIARAAGWL